MIALGLVLNVGMRRQKSSFRLPIRFYMLTWLQGKIFVMVERKDWIKYNFVVHKTKKGRPYFR